MKEWNQKQISKIKEINAWLHVNIKDSLKQLDKCSDGSHKMDILEDRIMQLRIIQESLPNHLLYK